MYNRSMEKKVGEELGVARLEQWIKKRVARVGKSLILRPVSESSVLPMLSEILPLSNNGCCDHV